MNWAMYAEVRLSPHTDRARLLTSERGGFGGAGISVVAAGLEEWDRWAPPPGLGNPQTVYEPRLQEQLGVDGFRLPPVAPQVAPGVYRNDSGKLIGVRFPRWLQCPQCHLIRQSRSWTEDAGRPRALLRGLFGARRRA